MRIYHAVSSSSGLMYAVIGFTIAVGLAMNIASSGLAELENKYVPDVRFGFTSDDISSLYNSWGEVGRSVYYRINTLDFMFIPCYTLLLGSLLVRTTDMSGPPGSLIYLTPISTLTAFCDVIETGILRRALIIFPLLIDEKVAQIGSLAQQMKWISLSLNIFLILFLGCREFYNTKKSKVN
mmetsp:Transcript_15007/g.19010  ORF Transcript_15007/g.19010 Transcript_15007/m.19010 type:complete len:181 (-) Transcript_15007:121-663(-)